MDGGTEVTAWMANLLDWTAWSSDPILGSWVPLLGIMLGVSVFLTWQRRHQGPQHVAGDASSLPSYRHAQNAMGAELARMRRYERALSVLVVRVDAAVPRRNGDVGANGKEAPAGVRDPLLAFWEVGSILRDLLRDSDVASTDMSKMQYVVVLPETNRDQATQTATRVRKLVYSTTGLTVLTGLAEFPDQGLILEDLVKRAENDCKQQQTVHGMVAQ